MCNPDGWLVITREHAGWPDHQVGGYHHFATPTVTSEGIAAKQIYTASRESALGD